MAIRADHRCKILAFFIPFGFIFSLHKPKAMIRHFFLLPCLFICIQVSAQKKPLDHSVYDSWQRIGERMISNDGKWVVYTIDPQEGDN